MITYNNDLICKLFVNEKQVDGKGRNSVGGSEREQKVQYKHEKRVSKNMREGKQKEYFNT